MSSHNLQWINSASRDEFVRVIGPVFEHSQWIARKAWEARPFAGVESLHQALAQVVQASGEEKQLALIRAHPDLVGRAALTGTLTPESNREQASAGLGSLTPEEIAAFESKNRAYRERFGFPFIICARLNKKEAILKGFDERLQNTRAKEIAIALQEIGKIAQLRLNDLVADG
jgi:2-oxo-4-hydroxy-4-carboxy-5-ureidoimidazoline decarboxylase